ncbi:type I restriction-modification system endonuclease [Bacillus weihaiensis]|uniref:type I restriction-modification system endonuclease n=1 Tax=Bacillus weihaiensis TaxID=1547283 RepID=UPI00235658FD|nr:type I restriction-modification system endonuclease [Bacillus weihaiensis]
MGNFTFFKEKWEVLAFFGESAERNAYDSPGLAIMALRSFAEQLAKSIVALEGLDEPKRDFGQDKRIRLLERNVDIIPQDIISIFHTIRREGNTVNHNGKQAVAVSSDEAIILLELGYSLASWFNDVYIYPPYKIADFVKPEKNEKIQKKLANLELELEQKSKLYEQTIAELKATPLSTKERANRRKRSINRHYPEKEARVIIDQQLREAGWETNTELLNYQKKKTMPKRNRNMAIAEWPTLIGPVDYALFIGMKLVGFIDAKSKNKNVYSVLQGQVKDYASNIKPFSEIELVDMEGEYQVPFLYASNGRAYNATLETLSGVWFFNALDRNGLSHANNGWHSPDELKEKLKLNVKKADNELSRKPLTEYGLYDYQQDAIHAIEKAIVKGKRRILLSMATGTGKTRTALTLMYRLLEANRFQRILYVVDRTSLAEQTEDSANALLFKNLTFGQTYTIQPVEETGFNADSRVRLATVQGLNQKLQNGELGTVGQYDFIIVDEAHRGYKLDKQIPEDELDFRDESEYQSQYKKVIDYFDAPVVGMTATPTLTTTQIFGDPIFGYSYSQAVIDQVLVDHDVPKRYHTKLADEGIKFKAGDFAEFINSKTGEIESKKLPDELNFDVTVFNKRVESIEFNKNVAIMIAEDIPLTTPGKTLIFAASNIHADNMVMYLKQAYMDFGEDIEDNDIMKITGELKNHNQAIRRFRNEERPKIVVTVDLLTTGIDVEDIVNLVFLRAIKSRVLYEQMLGRATRKSKNFVKEKFYIYDAVGVYDVLNNVTNMKPVATNPKRSIKEVLEDTLTAPTDKEFETNRRELVAKLNRKLVYLNQPQEKEINSILNLEDVKTWVRNLDKDKQPTIVDKETTINELLYYFRQNVDTTGGILISKHKDEVREATRGYGKGNQKPEDYIQSFASFIKEEKNKVNALTIAITAPENLTKQDLKELQLHLRNNTYTEEQLNSAYSTKNKAELVSDIISYIRQVSLGSPLESTETRVKRAIQRIKKSHSWADNQIKWLNLIEKQLISNIVLGPTAEQALSGPAFRDLGGLRRAKLAFKDINLDDLIKKINKELYVS